MVMPYKNYEEWLKAEGDKLPTAPANASEYYDLTYKQGASNAAQNYFTAKEYYDAAKKAAEKGADDTYNQAQKEGRIAYNRARDDAYINYLQNTAKYGAANERLNRAGLQASGYSDYITNGMYGTYRNEVATAAAERAAADRSARETYTNALQAAEAERLKGVAGAEVQLQSDLYSVGQDYLSNLKSMRDNMATTYTENFSDPTMYDPAMLEAYHTAGAISDEQYKKAMETYKYYNDISNPNIFFHDYETGKRLETTEQAISKLYQAYSSGYYTSDEDKKKLGKLAKSILRDDSLKFVTTEAQKTQLLNFLAAVDKGENGKPGIFTEFIKSLTSSELEKSPTYKNALALYKTSDEYINSDEYKKQENFEELSQKIDDDDLTDQQIEDNVKEGNITEEQGKTLKEKLKNKKYEEAIESIRHLMG